MEFLEGQRLTAKIRELFAAPGMIKAAVAYWGDGAIQLTGLDANRSDLQVVCCLKGGKSSPDVIGQFGKRARQIDNLHAKVIWTSSGAIVGSANMSSNGLPGEEKLAKGLLEAGMYVPSGDVADQIHGWFDSLYKSASTISQFDLDEADRARKYSIDPLNKPELIDLSPELVKDFGILVWGGRVNDETASKADQAAQEETGLDNADWFLELPRKAKAYPYGQHMLSFEKGPSGKLLKDYDTLYFPEQHKWRKISDEDGDFRLVLSLSMKPPVEEICVIGPRSIEWIRERLIARSLHLQHHIADEDPDRVFVSWENWEAFVRTGNETASAA